MSIPKNSRFSRLLSVMLNPRTGLATEPGDCQPKSGQQRDVRWLARSTAFIVLMAGLLTACASASLAQERGAAREGHFDFFRTVAENTQFDFRGDHAIPAGFFGEGSRRFEGTVFFRGIPLGTFQDHCVGNADTIMERKRAVHLGPPFPKSEKTEIELVALSLKSTVPIQVLVGGELEQWDVKVSLSTSQPSTGSMTITRERPEGGVASSEMNIFPVFTFERRKDGAKRQLDTGALKLPPLTLRATDFLWATKCPDGVLVIPGFSDNFCAGTTGEKQIPTPHCGFTGPLLHCHAVLGAEGPTLTP